MRTKLTIPFDKIGADSYSYNLEQYDALGNYINQGFYKSTCRGGTLILTLIYNSPDGQQRFLRTAPKLREVTLVSEKHEYDCYFLSVSIKQTAVNVFTAQMKFQCLMWGRWKKVEVSPELKAILIDSPMPTPINIEAQIADVNNKRFRVCKTLFECEDASKKILIDSNRIEIINARLLDPFDLIYWQGRQEISFENLKNIKISWRAAYAGLDH